LIEVDVWDTDEEIKTQNREYVERARSRRWSPVILNSEIYSEYELVHKTVVANGRQTSLISKFVRVTSLIPDSRILVAYTIRVTWTCTSTFNYGTPCQYSTICLMLQLHEIFIVFYSHWLEPTSVMISDTLARRIM
jgi:hypothetical protein